ncbi:Cytokinin riboside 5'-monophosphate phosphoribohydrolase [Psidium guajava]|nr:Cytokinin riboside 5'-monophosphate phosphoribohydrolase [Psidium guajava]
MTNHQSLTWLDSQPRGSIGKLLLTHHPSLSIHIVITNQAYKANSTTAYISSISTTTPLLSSTSSQPPTSPQTSPPPPPTIGPLPSSSSALITPAITVAHEVNILATISSIPMPISLTSSFTSNSS